MTDVAQSTIHPDTLEALKQELPILQDIHDSVDLNLVGRSVREAADGMRRMFPGLDDLTLAAIALWESRKAHTLLHEYGHESWHKEMLASGLVAYELAWPLLTPGGVS